MPGVKVMILLVIGVPIFLGMIGLGIWLLVLLILALLKYLRSDKVRKEDAAVTRSLGEILLAHRTRCHMTQEFVAGSLGGQPSVGEQMGEGPVLPQYGQSAGSGEAVRRLRGGAAERCGLMLQQEEEHDGRGDDVDGGMDHPAVEDASPPPSPGRARPGRRRSPPVSPTTAAAGRNPFPQTAGRWIRPKSRPWTAHPVLVPKTRTSLFARNPRKNISSEREVCTIAHARMVPMVRGLQP